MQIQRILLFLIIFSFNNFLYSLSISFSINCKVQDSVLFSMEDGKSTRYSKFEGDIGTGDNLILDFKFVLDEYGFYRLNVGSNIGSNYKFAASTIDSEYDQMFQDMVTFDGTNDIIFGDNYISMDGFKGVVRLKRYYKNDWSLLYEGSMESASELKSANCLGVSNKYSEMLQIIKSHHKNDKEN